jgi:hypothetical protein
MNNPNFPGVDDSAPSLDLPPALANILNMGASPVTPPPTAGMNIPSFQEGGLVGQKYFGGFTPDSIKGPTEMQRRYGTFGKPPVRGFDMDMATRENLDALKNLYRTAKENPDNIPESIMDATMGNSVAGMYRPGLVASSGGNRPTLDSVANMDLGMRYQGYLDNMVNPSTGGGIARDVRLGDQSLSMDIPSFQEGGMVGEGGAPIPPGAVPGMPMAAGVAPQGQAGAPMAPQMLQMQLNQFARQNPQQMAQIRQTIVQELQSGELTPQELNMIVQLATVASQNPEMYPNIRSYAIQQGIATEADLPAEYDQGLVFVLLLAARAVQQDLGGAPAEAGQAPGNAGPVVPTMAKGGMLPNSGKSEPIIIEAHTGEYVIPKHVVDMKGKEFFDSLVEKYKGKKND